MLVTRTGPIKVRRELIEAAEDITRPPPCRDIHCVSHAGFRASVCFQVYNPEFFGPEDFIANDTMGNGWRVGLKRDIIASSYALTGQMHAKVFFAQVQ